MTYTRLVWAALRRKPTRTVLTAASITTAFLLFGTLQGVNTAIDSMANSVLPTSLVVSNGVNSRVPMPISYVARIAALPGVAHATGTMPLAGWYQRPRVAIVAVGTDIRSMLDIHSQITVPPAQLAAVVRTRSAALVGRRLASTQGWKVGERITLHSYDLKKAGGSADWVFDIAGIYDQDPPELAAFILANYDYINEARASDKDQAVSIYVGVKDAGSAEPISRAIDALFAESPIRTLTQTEKDFVYATVRQVGNVNFLIEVIVGAVLFTLLFLTANSLAESVRERTPEFAVLRTLGFTDATVQRLVLAEALLLCVVAAAVGLVLAAMALPALINLPAAGIVAMPLPRSVFAAGAVIAVVLALASGIPVARNARRRDLASALSGR